VQRCILPALILLVSLGASGLSQPLTQDNLFDATQLQDIHLRIHPNDWASLQANFRENTYYPADFEWRGVQIENAGVRSRGNGSRNGQKPGLRIDFNRYVKGKHFLAMQSLILDNLWQDDSMMAETLAMEVFRKMGVPAPREAYGRVFINGTYFGLYGVVEDIDEGFLARNFEYEDGFLYEYKWVLPWRFEDLGQDPETYVPNMFKPVTHTKSPDAKSLMELVRLVNQAGDDEFAARIRQHLNVENFLTYLAVDHFVVDSDGFTGRWSMNNFFVHRPFDSSAFSWIAWDKDGAFTDSERSIIHDLGKNRLTRRLLSIPEYADFYLSKMEELAQNHGGEESWLYARARKRYELIRNSVMEDPNKRVTATEFEAIVEHVRHFIYVRSYNVMIQIESIRGQNMAALLAAQQ
jgi:spore coat protein CotH